MNSQSKDSRVSREMPVPKTASAVSEMLKSRPDQAGKIFIKMLTGAESDEKKRTLLTIANSPYKKTILEQILLQEGKLLGWMREKINHALREIRSSLVEPLTEILGGGETRLVRSALNLLNDIQDQKFIEPLANLLGSNDFWIRVRACEMLGRIGGERGVDALISMLNDRELKWSAIGALSHTKSTKALLNIARQIQDPSPVIRLEVLNAFEAYSNGRVLPLIQQLFAIESNHAVRERALEVYRHISVKNGIKFDENELRQAALQAAKTNLPLERYLIEARRLNASDLLVIPGAPLSIKIHGRLVKLSEHLLAPEQTRDLLVPVMTGYEKEIFSSQQQVDFCLKIETAGRYRANIFAERRGIAGVFRVIPNEIPKFDDIGLPSHLRDIANYGQGLVLVTGRSGSGKTTTLAALVNLINEKRRHHIITLEDPIEYMHPMKLSLVTQREARRHTSSFAHALRASLREDPDVIVVGEMRDIETMRLCLTAAETGHLVLSTLHTPNVVKAVDRMIDSFPSKEQAQIRMMLADVLKVVVGQSLLPAKGGQGRVACFEVLIVTPAVANQIRDDKTNQLPALMQISKGAGMRTYDMALLDLIGASGITTEEGYVRGHNKDFFRNLVSKEFLERIEGYKMPA